MKSIQDFSNYDSVYGFARAPLDVIIKKLWSTETVSNSCVYYTCMGFIPRFYNGELASLFCFVYFYFLFVKVLVWPKGFASGISWQCHDKGFDPVHL